MKKILFLLLLTCAGYAQTTTGQEQDFDYGIKNTASQLDDNAVFITVQNSDGTLGKSTASIWAKKIYVDNADAKKAFLSTGLIKNGLIQTGTSTTFNITAGIGVISNFDDPNNPTSTIVSFPAFTGITPTYLTSGNITYVAINSSAAVVMQASPFTYIQRRDLIILGAVIHSNLSTINTVNNISAPTNSGTNQLHDLMEAIGALNISGNKYTANGANLLLNKTAGDIFKLGVNFANNWKDPHKLNIASGTALSFRYRTQNGTEGSDVTALNPAVYDVANVLTAVPSNRFSIQTVTLFQTGLTRIQYGQATYSTLSEAEAAITTRSYNVEANIAANGITRAYIILKNTATSLQNASDTKIVEAGKFGNVGGSGGAITLDAIVAALGYTPENVANKSDSYTVSSSTTYASTKAIVDGLATKQSNIELWTAIAHPLNKVVKYQINGKFYIFQSNVANNTTVPKLTKGVQPFAPYIYGGSYVGVWSAGSYVVGNIVSRNSTLYYCLTNTTTDPQLLLPPYWLKIGTDQGVFNASFSGGYAMGDAVRDGSNNVYTSQLNRNSYALATVSDNSWDIINGQPFSVAAWGDSLTLGAGSNGNANYPSVLSSIAGLNFWNGGVSGETSTQIKARFLADKDKWDLPTIIWSGRNNYTSPTTVKADIAEMISKLTHTNYLVIGIIKATSDAAEHINTLNSDLKTLYGDRFIDMQPYLLSIYNPSIPQDVIDHGNGVIAWSMRSDWLHLSNLGYSHVAKLLNTKIGYMLGRDKQVTSNITSSSIQITGNEQGLQPVKGVEILYDTVQDIGVIDAYDRVTSTVKPLSIQYPLGSELRLVEQGGNVKIGDLPNYTTGSMYQLGLTTATLGILQRLPSGSTGRISKWTAQGVQGDSHFAETSNQISTPSGVGLSIGSTDYHIPPSDTQGVLNVGGSSAQFITLSNNAYLYGSNTLTRLLSERDFDIVIGPLQRMAIDKLTGVFKINNLSGIGSRLVTADASGNLSAPDVPTAPTAPVGTNTTQIATTAFVQASRPYKVYTALLSQSGTSAPTATVLENTLGTVVWTRSNTGQYVGTLTGAFTDQKTIIFVNRSNPAATAFDTNMAANVININTVGYTTFSNSAYVDGQTNSASIEIRVYN